MSKGEATREAILHEGLALASRIGFEPLSIGELARAVGMSKSGLYAHFRDKEELQIEVLKRAEALFNHPPFMVHVLQIMTELARRTGLPFFFWLRLPAILADVALRFDTVTWRSTGPGAVRWAGNAVELDHIELADAKGGRFFADGDWATAGCSSRAEWTLRFSSGAGIEQSAERTTTHP